MWIDRRGLAVACVLSLLCNVLLVGMLAGALLGRGGKGGFAKQRALVPRSSVRALSAEDRQRFLQAMAPYRDAIHDAWAKHRAARAAAEADIAAPVFDRAKVEADFAALRGAAAQAQDGNQAGLIDALSGLSASARAALVSHGGSK